MALYPRINWERKITTSLDLSGAPALAVATNNVVYFAASGKGVLTGTDGKGLGANASYRIFVGAYDPSGALLWLFEDPKLISKSVDSLPSISLGEDGELYISFMTTGTTPGNRNGTNIFSPCGTCGTFKGPEDVVVARINGAVEGNPRVAWVLQDYSLNTCAREMAPHILYDKFGKRLLLTYQTSGATVCQSRVGSPNVVVVALSTSGALGWVYQGNLVNSAGQNESPSIATDSSGNIYLAYSTTQPVSGGGAFQGVRDIQVVQLSMNQSACNTNISRGWILSALTNINSTVGDQEPALIYDPITNLLFLTFTTNGTVPGGSASSATRNLVIAAIQTNGALKWIAESPIFNEEHYKYKSLDHPQIEVDNSGNIYIAIRTEPLLGDPQIVVFSVSSNNGLSRWPSRWLLVCNRNYFRGYIAEYKAKSWPAIGIYNGNVYLQYVTTSNELVMFALEQKFQYQDVDAFDYMSLSICDSGCT
jgi:hypothetical protein